MYNNVNSKGYSRTVKYFLRTVVNDFIDRIYDATVSINQKRKKYS